MNAGSVKSLAALRAQATSLAERLDALSLRERGIIFFAGATLIYIAWQTLLMGPLSARERNAAQRLEEARRHLASIEQMGSAAVAASDPLIAASVRNRSLEERLTRLDTELRSAAEGYIEPARMSEMLRQVLVQQRGLRLISLRNLPVESLSRPAADAVMATASGSAPAAPTATAVTGPAKVKDIGPFLHPVELVVDGEYTSVVSYLRALEALPWRLHWERLELRSGDSSVGRVRLKIGALSLSPDWINI